MQRKLSLFLTLIGVSLLMGLMGDVASAIESTQELSPSHSLPFAELYQDDDMTGIWQRLWHRATVRPINLLFFVCFFLAIVHTFAAHRFARWARQKGYQDLHRESVGLTPKPVGLPEPSEKGLSGGTFIANLLFFFGEVEVVFGVWCGVLFVLASFTFGWSAILSYMASHDYSEAIFVAVALALASTYPIMRFADKVLSAFAHLGGGSPLAWWVLLLTIGPLLGAVMKESVAMTILALLMAKHFFVCRPSQPLAYATLGLLFTNISVSGLFTSFASSAVLMVAAPWKWDSFFMWRTFGWRGLAGIAVSNLIYFLAFHKELCALRKPVREEAPQVEVPLWVTAIHLLFLTWITVNSAYPIVVIGSFILFLGFYQATAPYQVFMNLREPLLVGFFLASLILISGLQTWWIEPIVEGLHTGALYLAALVITSFTHNASAALLFVHLPNLTESVKYLLICATMAGGGLTIMANGPNLVAYSILSEFFNRDMSFTRLFLAALVPTLVMSIFFLVF